VGVPVTGALLVTEALVVTGALVSGALLVTGALAEGGSVTTEGESGVGELRDGELLGGGGGLLAGEDGGGDEGGAEEVGGVDVDGGAGEVGGLRVGPEVVGPEGVGSEVVGPGGVEGVPPLVPPATLSRTYAPNRSSVPAGGSVAVTFESSDGGALPLYPTASPLLTSCFRACPNVAPVRSGTACRCRVSKAVSCLPAVPIGRSIPRSGSPTSTRTSRSIFCAAGRTATTEDAWYPLHFLLPSANLTEIRLASPLKGRSGFPHEHFAAGSPCSSTRIAIPAWRREL
jgi:hypothetical protein